MTKVEFDTVVEKAMEKFQILRGQAFDEFEGAERAINAQWPLPCLERDQALRREKAILNHRLDEAWAPYRKALGSPRPRRE